MTMEDKVRIVKEHIENSAKWNREKIKRCERDILEDAECENVSICSIEGSVRRAKELKVQLEVYEEVLRHLNDILDGDDND